MADGIREWRMGWGSDGSGAGVMDGSEEWRRRWELADSAERVVWKTRGRQRE